MVRRCAGSSQRRLSVTAEPIGISGARVRRRSTVTQPPPHELLDIGSSTQNLYRRSSVVELNRRTSVASNGSSSSRQRSSDLEITDKDMERLLILYNSKKIELNTNSHREEDLKPNSSNSKGLDTVTLAIILVLGILAIFAYIICR